MLSPSLQLLLAVILVLTSPVAAADEGKDESGKGRERGSYSSEPGYVYVDVYEPRRGGVLLVVGECEITSGAFVRIVFEP